MVSDDPVVLPEEKDSPAVATEQSHVTLIVFIVLAIAIILAIIFFSLFLAKLHKNQTTEKQAVVQTTISQIPTIQEQNSEVTKDTIIAKTLDVPPVYSKAQWEESPIATYDAALNNIFISFRDSTLSFHFKGQYGKTTIYNESSYTVGSYYYDALLKNGWFNKSGSGALQFRNFALTPQAEGGSCGGSNSYVGYKDGLVRMVTILEQITPCNPAGVKSVNSTANYTLFISDPISLNEMVAAIGKS